MEKCMDMIFVNYSVKIMICKCVCEGEVDSSVDMAN